MGNEQSGEENKNKFVKSGIDINESSFGYCENTSSYKGMKTDTEKFSNNESGSDISEKTTEQTLEIDDAKIPYTFEWKEGGNQVRLTGEFVNWKPLFEMSKNPDTGIFYIQIPLPRKVFMFKFIVDGTWRCSSYYPTKDDGSYNINNYVDLSKVEWVKPQVPPQKKENKQMSMVFKSPKSGK